MTDGTDKRRHKRIPTDRPARARLGEDGDEFDIYLKDVSGGGAAFGADQDIPDDELLELEIDDVGVMAAEMSRSLDDGMAVRFVDIDEQEEEMLMADLARLDSSMRGDDY
jgi:hypothetical protein